MKYCVLLILMVLFSGYEIRAADAAACPQLVDPVCAVDASKHLRTFNNGCEAVRAGARFLHQGMCLPEFCEHLCIEHGVYGKGVFSGRVKLYDNLCWAEKDFARYLKQGPCPGPSN